jgi:hypothetical protein
MKKHTILDLTKLYVILCSESAFLCFVRYKIYYLSAIVVQWNYCPSEIGDNPSKISAAVRWGSNPW